MNAALTPRQIARAIVRGHDPGDPAVARRVLHRHAGTPEARRAVLRWLPLPIREAVEAAIPEEAGR